MLLVGKDFISIFLIFFLEIQKDVKQNHKRSNTIFCDLYNFKIIYGNECHKTNF